MKKIISCLTALLLIATSFTACANVNKNAEDKNLSIVCTIFPEYDWVKEILGSHINDTDLTLLLDNGVDLHSFQPTADDIISITTSDIFIYVGGESDSWVDDVMKNSSNSEQVVINLLEVLDEKVKEEEVVEGMQEEDHDHEHEEGEEHEHEEGEEHEHEEGEEHEHEEEVEYDEHVWLSLKNTSEICSYISDELCKIDAENADDYSANTSAYIEKLNSLDGEYQTAVSSASKDTVLFGDRFPFRYLVDDYGLSYYAAFVGCSAETEASFETVTFLSGKVDELGLNSVLTIENNDHKIAQTIIDNTKDKNQAILTLNSMQSVTADDIKNGTTYLSIMEDNLEIIKTALN